MSSANGFTLSTLMNFISFSCLILWLTRTTSRTMNRSGQSGYLYIFPDFSKAFSFSTLSNIRYKLSLNALRLRKFSSRSSLFSIFIINACQIFSDYFSGIIIVMPKFLVKWTCLSSSQVVDKHYI